MWVKTSEMIDVKTLKMADLHTHRNMRIMAHALNLVWTLIDRRIAPFSEEILPTKIYQVLIFTAGKTVEGHMSLTDLRPRIDAVELD